MHALKIMFQVVWVKFCYIHTILQGYTKWEKGVASHRPCCHQKALLLLLLLLLLPFPREKVHIMETILAYFKSQLQSSRSHDQ